MKNEPGVAGCGETIAKATMGLGVSARLRMEKAYIDDHKPDRRCVTRGALMVSRGLGICATTSSFVGGYCVVA